MAELPPVIDLQGIENLRALNPGDNDEFLREIVALFLEDTPQRLVLKLQGGKTESIPRAEVEEDAVSPVSLMPEGLERQLTPQELADLFAFLTLDKPPADPEAKRLPGAPMPKGR